MKDFDIVIVGSGLSSYSAIKYLIYKKINVNKKICIIAGNTFRRESELDNNEIRYIKEKNTVVYKRGGLKEINTDLLRYSIKNKINLLSIESMGGLAKYWGGGFFIERKEDKKDLINDYIIGNYKYITNSEKNYFIRNDTRNKNITPIICNFLRSSEKNDSGEYEILNPGEEIEVLSRNKNISLLLNHSVKTISYDQDCYFINTSSNETIKSKSIILAAGIVNTYKILYDSSILKNKSIKLYDHALYRIPLIRPVRLAKLIVKYIFNKNIVERKTISSLKQAFQYHLNNKNIFIGLYHLDITKINLPNPIAILFKYDVIIFSQIYVEDKEKKYYWNYSKTNSTQNNNKIHKSLSLIEWKKIILFFLKNAMLPIPFSYKLPFGSSYHLYGSQSSFIHNKIMNTGQNLIIVDSSSLNEIGSKPSSFRLIKNTVKIMEEFVKVLN